MVSDILRGLVSWRPDCGANLLPPVRPVVVASCGVDRVRSRDFDLS